MLEHLPAALRLCVEESARRETPKEDDPAFRNAYFVMLMGTDDLFHPAHFCSEAKGFFTCCDNSMDDWAVEQAAEYLLDQLSALQAANPRRPVALIADGEVSSPVTGDGIGGRNSAFVLACVENIVGRRVAVLSAGTDGIDGNSPAAGAVADGDTLARAAAAGLDPADAFRRSDAFTFFAALDDAVVTGPTGNNLRDLRILLSEP
jgi:hydroxypyruvate reductase